MSGLRDYLPVLRRPDTTAIAEAATGQRMTRPVAYVQGGATGVSMGSALGGSSSLSAVDGLTSSAVVYRCVQTNTNPLAALEVGVRRTGSDGKPGDLDTTHPMAALWNRLPNPLASAYVLKSIIWQQLELAGESFVYLDRGEAGDGPVTALWNIFHPVTVIASKQVAGQIDGYVVNVNGAKVGLLPSEVLWLRYPHPTNPWGSLAPWRAASWAAELDAHARGWQLGEYVNGARPEGIFYLGDVDEPTHNAVVESWRSRHVGARNALKHLFLSGSNADGPAPSYTRVGLTPAEMSYIESRKVSAEEIMLAFGIHPDLLRGGATFENQRAAKVNQWTETLIPKLEVISSESDRQLLPDVLETFEFDTSTVDALQENLDARVKRTQQLMYVDAILVDEAREAVGLEPLPDGRGQFTLTAFRQNELDNLPAAIAERLTLEQAARFALSIGADVPPHVPNPRRRTLEVLPAQLALEAPAARLPGEPTWREGRGGTRVMLVSESAVLKAYDRLEGAGSKAVQRLAEKQARVVLRKLKDAERKAPSAPGIREVPLGIEAIWDQGYWQGYTRDSLEQWISAVYDAGGMTTAGALGIAFDVFDPAVTAAMGARLEELAEVITTTTRQALEAELLKPGVEAGESIPKLSDRIGSVFTQLAGHRATTIARTETVGGFNAASRSTAKASGVAMHREWLATRDDRTRETHRDLDGYETKDMDDAYPNGCLFPGDPSGPAAETINCRCVELYALDTDD